MPADYSRLITDFGDGHFCGELFLTLPFQVLGSTLALMPEILDGQSFWNCNLDGFDTALWQDLRVIGGTCDGDLLTFLPDSPDTIWFLPRHAPRLWQLQMSLEDALRWYLQSGEYGPKFPLIWFEPDSGRKSQSFRSPTREDWFVFLTEIQSEMVSMSLEYSFVSDDFYMAFFPEQGVQLSFDSFQASLKFDVAAQNEKVKEICGFLKKWGFVEL